MLFFANIALLSQKNCIFARSNNIHYYNKKKMDKVSYALGLGIGRQLCDMGAQGCPKR